MSEVERGMYTATAGQQLFGHAQLGHGARTKRLVRMADQALETLRGSIAQVFHTPKEREGAYRFVENDEISIDELELARDIACARRMGERGGVCVVAVDQTSVVQHDRRKERGFGSIGKRSNKARGMQFMTALALSAEGAPDGVLRQLRWSRSEERTPRRKPHNPDAPKKDRRPREQRESKYWPQVLSQALGVLKAHAPGVTPWFQCDQAADDWQVYTTVLDGGARFTVRAYRDRRCVTLKGTQTYLRTWLNTLPIAYEQELHVCAREQRAARVAKLAISYGELDVQLKVTACKYRTVRMFYVQARERRPPQHVKEPIHWILATNQPVRRRQDAEQIIENYRLRWRIEDFHRAFKSGACNIEACQLQSRAAFERWAIFVSSMAALVEQLKHLARNSPTTPASSLLSREEIDALIAVRRLHTIPNEPPFKPGDDPPVSVVERWLADLGGYMHSPHRSRPGTVVLTRGLILLENYVVGIRAYRRLLDSS
jgi:hypothetical protein